MSDGIDRFERIPSLIPVREEALRHLAHAASDTSSPFRTVSVATIGHDGTPQVRTMIFRGFVTDAATPELYTLALLDALPVSNKWCSAEVLTTLLLAMCRPSILECKRNCS